MQAIVVHTSLLGLFRSRVTGIRLECWSSGDRITPGKEDFGSIARRYDDGILFRYRHALKAQERASGLGALSPSTYQGAVEHGETSRNQPSLEETAARQALDQDLSETGMRGGRGHRLIVVLHGPGSFRHRGWVAQYMVMEDENLVSDCYRTMSLM
jgi:hypothetical protein